MIDFTNPGFGVDITGGLAMLGGNAKIYLKLLGTYHAGDLYEKFCQAVNAGDVDAAQVAAHTMKGACGNLHLNELFEKIKVIEAEIKQSHALPPEAELKELEQIQDATMHTIATLLQNPEQIHA